MSYQGGILEYEVFRDGVPAGITSTLTFTDSALTGGTTYVYTVVTKGNNGMRSIPSAPLSVTTTTPVVADPDAPINLASGDITDTAIELTWDAVTYVGGIANYDIYRDGVLVGNPTTNSYTDDNEGAGLTPDTQYTYKVIAVGNNSQSSVPSVDLVVSTTL